LGTTEPDDAIILLAIAGGNDFHLEPFLADRTELSGLHQDHQAWSGIDLATVVGFILAHVSHSTHEAFFRAVNPSFGLGFGQKPFILDETFIADEDIIFLDAGHWLLLGSGYASALVESLDQILAKAPTYQDVYIVRHSITM
jgi:hypothetical protein